MSDVYEEVKAHFADDEGVIVNAGRGAQGLKVGKKMFAMFYKGQLTVMLSLEGTSVKMKDIQSWCQEAHEGEPRKDISIELRDNSKKVRIFNGFRPMPSSYDAIDIGSDGMAGSVQHWTLEVRVNRIEMG